MSPIMESRVWYLGRLILVIFRLRFEFFWRVLILGEINWLASKEQASNQRDESDLRLDAARIRIK